MDVSGFDKLKQLSYSWYELNGTSANSELTDKHNLIFVVPRLEDVGDLCRDNSSLRGVVKEDFLNNLNAVVDKKPVNSVKFRFSELSKGVEQMKPNVDKDLWKKIHLFLDEAVSNVAMHSGQSDCDIDAVFFEDKSVALTVTDKGGKLSSEAVKRNFCSLCSFYKGGDEFAGVSCSNINIGGNGLRLLFHYVTFIKFNVIPSELTQIVGFFVPSQCFSGYIFEDRREEILNGSFFGKG